jgi:hypothetical protein
MGNNMFTKSAVLKRKSVFVFFLSILSIFTFLFINAHLNCLLAYNTQKSSSFFKDVYEKPQARNSDLIKACAMIITGDSAILPFHDALNLLKDRGLIPEKWDLKKDDPINKGFMCNVLFRVIRHKTGYRGGINIRSCGVSDRYAYKELLHLDIASSGGSGKTLTGGDLVASFTKADNFISKRRK